MSNIKIDGVTYREEEIERASELEIKKAFLAQHSEGELFDHPDGYVTLAKLADEVKNIIISAQQTADTCNYRIEEAISLADDARIFANNLQGKLTTVEMNAYYAKEDCENSKLAYKVFQIPSGGTFQIKPEMLCVMLPSGGKTAGIYARDDSQLISGSIGAAMVFSAEINTGEYANGQNHRIAMLYQPQSALTLLSSYTHLIDTGAYFRNNGDGNMYVFALMREVAANDA